MVGNYFRSCLQRGELSLSIVGMFTIIFLFLVQLGWRPSAWAGFVIRPQNQQEPMFNRSGDLHISSHHSDHVSFQPNIWMNRDEQLNLYSLGLKPTYLLLPSHPSPSASCAPAASACCSLVHCCEDTQLIVPSSPTFWGVSHFWRTLDHLGSCQAVWCGFTCQVVHDKNLGHVYLRHGWKKKALNRIGGLSSAELVNITILQ